MQTPISPQHIALLQTMGINLYKSIESLEVCEFGWLVDIRKLLKIKSNDILFDSTNIKYDKENQTLHLPAKFYGTEVELKQSIWREIQPFVYFEN